MNRLKGKKAVVIGAGGGIGKAIAYAYAAEGATVAMLDINRGLVTAAAASAPNKAAKAYVCDVSNRSQVFECIADFAKTEGGLDVLANTAIYFNYAPLTEMEPDVIDKMLDVGLKGTFWGIQAATPYLIQSQSGSIINFSSVAVSYSIKNAAVYTSIKGAIDALTRQQAVELGAQGVRVNAIAPGPIPTPGTNTIIDEKGWELRKSQSPLGRLADVDDIAAAAVYLASDESRCVNGVTLKVDSGITIKGT
ncbi:MAG: SDR family oxidoreductase [Burkholderiaceae bacterium]|nr:SDR family oxidoreductase [Burkholderiaceae bacterium]